MIRMWAIVGRVHVCYQFKTETCEKMWSKRLGWGIGNRRAGHFWFHDLVDLMVLSPQFGNQNEAKAKAAGSEYCAPQHWEIKLTRRHFFCIWPIHPLPKLRIAPIRHEEAETTYLPRPVEVAQWAGEFTYQLSWDTWKMTLANSSTLV